MYPSSMTCRAQEAHQRLRAADTDLPNIRDLAGKAAAAWAREALTAERREQRFARKQLIAEVSTCEDPKSVAKTDCVFSENPDRGMA